MSPETIPTNDNLANLPEGAANRWREAGRELAGTVRSLRPKGRIGTTSPNLREGLRALIGLAAGRLGEESVWLTDNARLILAAERQTRELRRVAHRLPVATDTLGPETPQVRLLAAGYFECSANGFQEDEFAAFVEGYQLRRVLEMTEFEGLKAALLWELIERLLDAPAQRIPDIVTSIRKVADAQWGELVSELAYPHRILSLDPAAVYSRMDRQSQDSYRKVVVELARHSPSSEPEVAAAAVELAERAAGLADESRAMRRRTHVGYYLVDRGLYELEAAVGYKAPWYRAARRALLRRPTVFYLLGIELITLAIAFSVLYRLDSFMPAMAGLALLALPATQAAVDFMNKLAALVAPARALPKLDFSEGIPEDSLTLVAVPTLLLNEAQVHDLVLDLEIRFLANRDRNLYFALVTDTPDSDRRVDERDALVEVCRQLIESLNGRYRSGGRAPFLMLHRHRSYNASEGRWIGWERKRGKLMDLNQLLRGGFDAFPVKVGDTSILRYVSYVITLDSDTQLPRDSAARLIGAIAHPLNQAVIDPVSRIVVEGYGILQPRIGISVQSATRSRLAALYSGQTGFDIYTRAVSDVYQDLFGEGIFTGKGIYEVDAMREALEHRFPENTLLSHDLMEGAYARSALVSDVELIDDYPSHFSAYSRRKHRWMRGDWQIMRWVRMRVPGVDGRPIPNPITLISRWKILDNLRRSLLEPSILVLLAGGWFLLPGQPARWTLATLGMMFVPAFSVLLFAPLRAPWKRHGWNAWVRQSARAFAETFAATFCSLVFLLHQSLISLDATIRSLDRVLVSRRKLLEWETAAEAEASGVRSATVVDAYLQWTPSIAAGIALLLWLLRPGALPSAAPILLLWAGSRVFSNWLNRRPRPSHSKLSKRDTEMLRDSADRIWRFFGDWSSASTNWMIPDNVKEDGTVDLRLSPTNLGMLLNARVAAVYLGLLRLPEFVAQTRQTLDRIRTLPKFRGHLLNWYDVTSLEPVAPLYVSTVDSGNLAASLWALKQAALAFARERAVKRGVSRELAAELTGIAEDCHRMVQEMDFRFLYRRRRKLLSIGYDLVAREAASSCYDLLASEARTAYFVAIAKGDIPQESWFRLGRGLTGVRGERALLSWTGSMFEYLMPALWMRHYADTILGETAKAVVRVQREYARRKGTPWGISESAHAGPGGDQHAYAPFGIPALALKPADPDRLVISPYSTFLAASVDAPSAVSNLVRMQEFEWTGRYGFYEAIDYSEGGARPLRLWMAHHQGMSLLALANLLFDNPMQQHFHREPQVLATERLLYERLSADVMVDDEIEPAGLPAAAHAAEAA